ncbi:uncharacterized protein HMPREF1541_10427 [Cyphellophora europaea CBS 101466]|uniref:Uncharacterized protein n=1 Tax=Cyphellophora europaea (strain CBS 101466) TaxID=1220924 RepID=W2S7V5_CYPE1|nr:uncharacterized protein HMPREF1541_10427 [Cyphellophora europaea CBS 101466]ETN44757.1 hypothetical protein HMPREF1541_10427 [Cyphellophora europaea CBS 101466]
MAQIRATAEAARFEAERRLKHQGSARVALDSIELTQRVDRKRVEHLKFVFGKEGCRPEHIVNHALLSIDKSTLHEALKESGISPAALLVHGNSAYPVLRLPRGKKLMCLHGNHRIQAGKEHLSVRDQWWIVDLYLADINRDVAQFLIEEYANEADPTDGEVYCKIRKYHFERNLNFERRWWARLKGSRPRSLQRLLRHDEIRSAFDNLLDIPGQWYGMQLTTVNKMMGMNFEEGIVNALNHIRWFWHDLLDGDIDAMRQVNDIDVKALESLAPGASQHDFEAIERQVRGGNIFGSLDQVRRADILERLRRSSGLVPTLRSFFHDINYWDVCLGGLLHLFSPSHRDTMISAMQSHFTGINQRDGFVMIQSGEGTFIAAAGAEADQVEYGYRQLFVFVMRHFKYLPRPTKRGDLSCKPRATADPAVLHQFASLAQRLGFESPEIESILLTRPDREPEVLGYCNTPAFVRPGSGEECRQRSGIPPLSTFREDRTSLYLHFLDKEQNENNEGITSFYVRQSVYLQFLGRSNGGVILPEASGPSATPPQRPYEVANFHDEAGPGEVGREEAGSEEDWGGENGREGNGRGEDRRDSWTPIVYDEMNSDADPSTSGPALGGRILGSPDNEGPEMLETPDSDTVAVSFKILDNGTWRDVQTLQVYRADPSEVARVAKKSMRKGFRTMDTNMQLLAPDDCFEAATIDGTNTILLIPQADLDVDEGLVASANVVGYTAIAENERKKTRVNYLAFS